MPLSAQQICADAAALAKIPGAVAKAGRVLNTVLSELCQTYDFEIASGTYYFNFDPGLTALIGNSIFGSGPYPLPADFLRCKDGESVFWTNQGVPYPLIPIDLAEFDMAVQQAGLQSYPYWFCTDVSIADATQQDVVGTTAVAYVYAPPSGAYPVTVRYQKQMPDIVTPETSTTVPWFPNTNYLVNRVAGEIMRLTDDDRWEKFLGDGPAGAEGILRKYLMMKDNKTNRAQTVKMDRRYFGSSISGLPNTKQVGW